MAQSVYTKAFDDPNAFHFTYENFGVKANGQEDVSELLQSAINRLKKEQNFGILFIPEGKYLISKTIYIPKAVRLIGYGGHRPELILGRHSPGYQDELKYMFWFTSGMVENEQSPEDANAGTFYSAMSNIDFRIEKGNPKAVAIRSHFAQHSFISHCNFHIGEGYAGIHDLGNEIEDLKFFGGQYGITSKRTSPGWPMSMIDLYFEGQKYAAIQSRNTGMFILGMHVKRTPIAVELEENVSDRLYMENCLFEDVETGVVVGVENRADSQINLVNILCTEVDTPVLFSGSGKTVSGRGRNFEIVNFVHGLVMESMADDSSYENIAHIESLEQVPESLEKVIPDLPSMEEWVSVKAFGAVGDGISDDTQAIKNALNQHENVYMPSGWYRVSETITLNPGNKLIGMHPFATQLVIDENEGAFSGFGSPVALLESSQGGDDMVNGIGLNTGGYNNRAVALKWMASEHSYVNDLKIAGCHGTMARPGESVHKWWHKKKNASSPLEPVFERGQDLAWDNQFWSIWITNNGGGIFKDIWSASTYASTGLFISDTSTPGRIYAMSIEHHVRQEARMNNVSGWKIYGLQFEEEGLEGVKAQTMNLANCNDLMFANLWMYRTIRVKTARPWGIKVSNCENIDFRNMRSWTQMLQLPEVTVFDMDKQLTVYPGDFARVVVTGEEERRGNRIPDDRLRSQQLGSGYEFATGAVSDSSGNVYFCDHLLKRIYKYSAATESVSVFADYPYKPLSLAVDTEDNLIVICRYDPYPGEDNLAPNVTIEKLPDNNRLYSGWGNGGWAVLAFAINPNHPDSFHALDLRKSADLSGIKRVIHPTHRWRADFDEIVEHIPENCFVAPDGVTIIPNTFDLCRSIQLFAVTPNQKEPVYVSHEDHKTTYRFRVSEFGSLVDGEAFVSRGEYSHVVDPMGVVYLVEGEILIFDREANEIGRIQLEDRIHSITWGGPNNQELFATTSSGFYRIKL